MERYIEKINKKLEKKDKQHVEKIKLVYIVVGGIILAIGLAGFLASFVTFMVLFFKFKTDDAFIAWIVAVPFLLLLILGSVITRIGDALRHYGTIEEGQGKTAETNASIKSDNQPKN